MELRPGKSQPTPGFIFQPLIHQIAESSVKHVGPLRPL
jgi:hypothetical protein